MRLLKTIFDRIRKPAPTPNINHTRVIKQLSKTISDLETHPIFSARLHHTNGKTTIPTIGNSTEQHPCSYTVAFTFANITPDNGDIDKISIDIVCPPAYHHRFFETEMILNVTPNGGNIVIHFDNLHVPLHPTHGQTTIWPYLQPNQ